MGYSEVVLHPGVEIIPGFFLVSWLGRGGFGDVWQAIGSDDRPCALKLLDLGYGSTAREARGLEYVKSIRHPHLLEIRGISSLGNSLVIIMELAGGTLMDRLSETRGRGRPGIPAQELIDYMRQAALGIDHLNAPHHCIDGVSGARIVHQDIKPHNLLLVDDLVKVADFGFAKILERSTSEKTAGLTPAYAPPEFFKGEVSSQSDQYSLAITYCQLRGGRLPFTGNPYQLMARHTSGVPDLTMIPELERDVVVRALAKTRDERWPSCCSFIEALSKTLGSERPSAESREPRAKAAQEMTTIEQPPNPALPRTRPATAVFGILGRLFGWPVR